MVGGGGAAAVTDNRSERVLDGVAVCAWCSRVRFDGEWTLDPMRDVATAIAPEVTSSICPTCFAAAA